MTPVSTPRHNKYREPGGNVDVLNYIGGGNEPAEFELFLLMSHSQVTRGLRKLGLYEDK